MSKLEFSEQEKRKAADYLVATAKKGLGTPASPLGVTDAYRDAAIGSECRLNRAIELLQAYPRIGGASAMVWDNTRCDFLQAIREERGGQ